MARTIHDVLSKGNAPSVWVLQAREDGPVVGHVMTAFTVREAPSGGHTCYAVVQGLRAHGGDALYGSAGGGGYCKRSGAIADALSQVFPDAGKLHGAGIEAVEEWFRRHGYWPYQLV